MSKTQTTTLAKIDTTRFPLLSPEGSSVGEALLENLGDVSDIDFADLDRAHLPSGSSKTFNVITAEGEQSAAELEGIILLRAKGRSYWKDKYDGSNMLPDCISVDMFNGIGDPGGKCGRCPKNEWGSAREGNGKACSEIHTLIIAGTDEISPLFVLRVTPGSLKNLRQYLTRLATKGRTHYSVVTRFSLTQTTSDSITYSQLTLALVGTVPEESMAAVKQLKAQFEAATRARPEERESGPPALPPVNDPEFAPENTNTTRLAEGAPAATVAALSAQAPMEAEGAPDEIPF